MEYVVDYYVSKIESPVVLIDGDKRFAFSNGMEVASARFDRRLTVVSIRAAGDEIELQLKELPPVNMAWVGEDAVSFF